MKQESLGSKLVLVTGGSRGIGLEIASAFHEEGAAVAITGRDQKTLVQAARRVGPRCHAFVCDQRDPAAVEALMHAVITKVGAPEILVNNAACFEGGETASFSTERWNDVIQTNLTGTFLITRAFMKSMIAAHGGDIFMIDSMSGKKADAGSAAYAASKFGLLGFAQALMYELRQYNIRVMTLCPSRVNTDADTGPRGGKGVHLHAADIAATIVHMAKLPGRTLIREMELWGTNP